MNRFDCIFRTSPTIAHGARWVVQLRILVYMACLCVHETVRDIPGMGPDMGRLVGHIMDIDAGEDGAESNEGVGRRGRGG